MIKKSLKSKLSVIFTIIKRKPIEKRNIVTEFWQSESANRSSEIQSTNLITSNLLSLKNKFINLSIGKRMNFAFIYVGMIYILIISIALINIKSIESKMNAFYTGPHSIDENVRKAHISMVKIENNIYKAYMTKMEDLCKKYIQETEKEYAVIEDSIKNLRNAITKLDTSIDNVIKLEGEIKKGERYRTQILDSANDFDQKNIKPLIFVLTRAFFLCLFT